jgi:hypothetical protein
VPVHGRVRTLYPRSFLCFFLPPTLLHYFFILILAWFFPFSQVGWTVAHGVWVLPREATTVRGCLMICILIWSLKICLYCVFSIASLPCPHLPPRLFHPFRLGHPRNDLAMYSITSYQRDKAGRSRTKEILKKKNDPKAETMTMTMTLTGRRSSFVRYP